MPLDPRLFGPRLLELRTRAELSQAALARAAGLHADTVGKVERGDDAPTWGTALALADALRVRLEDFTRPVRTGAEAPRFRGGRRDPDWFRGRLGELRAQAGLTQAALARAAGLHPGYLSQVEQGHYSPNWAVALALADALAASPDHFARPPRADEPRGRGRPPKQDACPGSEPAREQAREQAAGLRQAQVNRELATR